MPLTERDYEALLGRVKSRKTGVDFWCGVDPGTNTGLALWDSQNQRFVSVASMGIVMAMQTILAMRDTYREVGKEFHIVCEDTRRLRLPKHLQSQGRERGMGSVHRDMSILEEFFRFYNLPHTMAGLCPKAFRTGDAEWFRNKTGWEGRTNEHGRAAAGMVWGR